MGKVRETGGRKQTEALCDKAVTKQVYTKLFQMFSAKLKRTEKENRTQSRKYS